MAGGAWMVATRWALRILGLVNVAILARLLSPHDFGVVAMAMAFVAIADSIMNAGAESAVIQMGQEGRRYYDAAWTMRMAQNFILAAIICVLAVFAPSYYDEPRIEMVLYIVALGAAIRAFDNIGVVAVQQDLRYAPTFYQLVISQLIAIVVAITIAVIFRSYWALVLGSLARTCASTVLSYVLFPYRPRFVIAGWQRIWSFSKWYVVTNLGKTLYFQGLPLTLGRVAGSGPLGVYTVSAELASTAALEVAMPISRVLYTGMVHLRDDMVRYRKALLQALHAVALITTPICFGLAATAEEVVPLALGDGWDAAVNVMRVLTMAGALHVISLLKSDQLVVLGHLKRNAVVSWIHAAILLTAGAFIYRNFGLIGVAALTATLQSITLTYMTVTMARVGVATIFQQVGSYIGPFVAGGAMTATLLVLAPLVKLPLIIMLAAKIVLGAVIYAGLILLFWQLAGRPEGLERKICEQISHRWKKLAGRFGKSAA